MQSTNVPSEQVKALTSRWAREGKQMYLQSLLLYEEISASGQTQIDEMTNILKIIVQDTSKIAHIKYKLSMFANLLINYLIGQTSPETVNMLEQSNPNGPIRWSKKLDDSGKNLTVKKLN
jgi:hypothetical protein